jgi:hypothetical protein
LAEQLHQFHGYSHAAHEEMDREHHTAVMEHILLEQFNDILKALPDTLGSDTILQYGQFSYFYEPGRAKRG